MSIAFETERLVAYRGWAREHAEALFALYGDPEVVRYIGNRLLPDLDAMRANIDEVTAKYARYGKLFVGPFTLAKKSTGAVIGTGLLKYLPEQKPDGTMVDTTDVEIGWHLARAYWGMGYATEVGHALLALGFAHHDVDVIHAVVEPPNLRSAAVAKRIGLTHVGRTTRYYGRELEHFEARREPDEFEF
jgi:ribosomal-protein-alanine N-acetyltransferase